MKKRRIKRVDEREEKKTNESHINISGILFDVRNQHFFLHNKNKEFVNQNKWY